MQWFWGFARRGATATQRDENRPFRVAKALMQQAECNEMRALQSAQKMPAVVWAQPASPESGKGSVASGFPMNHPKVINRTRCLTDMIYDSREARANAALDFPAGCAARWSGLHSVQ
jgi:hypothetical protein